MEKKDRVILHCDMNGFYASVELLAHPELKDKPVAVCGAPESRHGIILAKNELAKMCIRDSSHLTHLFALIHLAKQRGIKNLYIHCFMDGRDVPPTSGITYMQQLTDFLKKEEIGQIGIVSGRYYAMDRDKRWDRVALAYDALTLDVYKRKPLLL